ncbi:hypothetical protein [Oceanobacillus chungangensis]|uniref:hypothetical protein n=1 Tax=Oceanobacillus chungangensis TaxID=1229152 RepID=UPI003CCC8A75
MRTANVAKGHYSKSITLKNGKNEITVTAGDKAGNVSQATKVVVKAQLDRIRIFQI